ncbi:MAG: hypothetical protein ABI741_02615 [Ferruginibacter sp.]
MLTIIILTGIAIIALCIGFFEVRLPFINGRNITEKKNKSVNEPAKTLEGFYRSLRAESWLYNVQNRSTSDVA